MYTRTYSPPTPPPKNYGGTMYKETAESEIYREPTENCNIEAPKEKSAEGRGEELLLIGLLLLLILGGAENDAILLIGAVLILGFI